jgi:hypothetical protein
MISYHTIHWSIRGLSKVRKCMIKATWLNMTLGICHFFCFAEPTTLPNGLGPATIFPGIPGSHAFPFIHRPGANATTLQSQSTSWGALPKQENRVNYINHSKFNHSVTLRIATYTFTYIIIYTCYVNWWWWYIYIYTNICIYIHIHRHTLQSIKKQQQSITMTTDSSTPHFIEQVHEHQSLHWSRTRCSASHMGDAPSQIGLFKYWRWKQPSPVAYFLLIDAYVLFLCFNIMFIDVP